MHVRAARRAGYNLRHAAPPSALLSSGKGRRGSSMLSADAVRQLHFEGPGSHGWAPQSQGGSFSYGSQRGGGGAGGDGWPGGTEQEYAAAMLRSRTSDRSGGDVPESASGGIGAYSCPPSMPGSMASSRVGSCAYLSSVADASPSALQSTFTPAGTIDFEKLGDLGGMAGIAGRDPFGTELLPERPISERLLEFPHASAPLWEKGLFLLNLPLSLLLWLLMPSARAMGVGWFPWAMFVSVVLLALITYALSTLCDFIASAWGIPDELLGSTVVAMGTSLPNVFAAISVGRAGKADMAVCQAFGSNAFDVLVAFALPLAVKSAALGGIPLQVEAPNLSQDVTVDLIFVALFLVLVGLYRGRMRPSFGLCALMLYLCWFTANLVSVYAHELDRILKGVHVR
jgi:hypothetical protein